jgi:predicted dehydrogenase
MPLRIGLFGAGAWARNIVRLLAAREDVHIAAVLVHDTSKPRDGLGDAPIYDDVETLLSQHALDGAVIATPPGSHARLCVAALNLGVPCFVEKPAALSTADMERIAATAIVADVPVVVDYVHLYSSAFGQLLAEVRKRGRPRKIAALAGNPAAAPRDCSVLWDWGAHDVAMTRACLGAGDVTVAGLRIWPKERVFDSVRLDLRWDGIPVRFKFSQHLPRKTRHFSVQYDDEVLVYTDRPEPTLSRMARGVAPVNPTILAGGADNPLATALDSFLNKARKRGADRADLAFSADVTRVLELCEGRIAV